MPVRDTADGGRSPAVKRLTASLTVTVFVAGGFGWPGGVRADRLRARPRRQCLRLGTHRWCPGDSLYLDRGGPYQGVQCDMNACRTWYNMAEGAGNVDEGPHNRSSIWDGPNPPPPAPPPASAPPGCPRLPALAGTCGFRIPAPAAKRCPPKLSPGPGMSLELWRPQFLRCRSIPHRAQTRYYPGRLILA
jgi:hypothetical protein